MEGTFLMHNDQRNLETIPAGALGMIPLESCREIGEKVDKYLVKWRCVREHEHENAHRVQRLPA